MNTAMILCAGFGTRMQDFTKDSPKPMLPINGKPILEYTLRHLAGCGINNIVINVHYLAGKITDYFKSGETLNIKITYSHETDPLGTAGAVRNVRNILGKEDNFLVLYGDVICNQNYADLFAFHASRKDAVASIILHERQSSNSVVEMDSSGKIVRFIERPKQEVKDKKQNWVNSGLYCFNSKVFDYIPDKAFSDFPKDVFPALLANGAFYGFPLNGYRCAIDSPERYLKAQEDFKHQHIFS